MKIEGKKKKNEERKKNLNNSTISLTPWNKSRSLLFLENNNSISSKIKTVFWLLASLKISSITEFEFPWLKLGISSWQPISFEGRPSSIAIAWASDDFPTPDIPWKSTVVPSSKWFSNPLFLWIINNTGFDF